MTTGQMLSFKKCKFSQVFIYLFINNLSEVNTTEWLIMKLKETTYFYIYKAKSHILKCNRRLKQFKSLDLLWNTLKCLIS